MPAPAIAVCLRAQPFGIGGCSVHHLSLRELLASGSSHACADGVPHAGHRQQMTRFFDARPVFCCYLKRQGVIVSEMGWASLAA